MISIQECREELEGLNLSDTEVKQLRDSLYSFIEGIMERQQVEHEERIKKSVNILPSVVRQAKNTGSRP
jgi:hypothetical protein